MAKIKRQSHKLAYDEELFNKGIEEVDASPYIRKRMIIYGANVSVSRACAALFDGLTPARRRILWNMYHDYKLVPSHDYAKVPEFLFATAKYHPHGNLSIEGTFNSMIKEFESNAPLIEVPGNTGSVTGGEGAAVRYLDARLSKYCYKCFFEEFDPDITEMTRNYIDTDWEPVWIPSKYPNFLLHMITGIGWGNSYDMVPFNLEEVFRLTQQLLLHPETSKVFLFPDSPRGYNIIDDGNIVDICERGNGTIKIRARMDYDEAGNYISVTGFPEEVTMDAIMQTISELVNDKKISGITDLSDESDIGYAEFYIHLKKGTDPLILMDRLYKLTKLEHYAQLEFNFADRIKMNHLGLKDALLTWIDHRIDTKQKYCSKKLSKLEERKHVLEVLLKVLTNDKNFEKATDIIKKSANDAEALEKLVKDFDVTSYQANIISEIGLKQRNKDRVAKIKNEYKEIDNQIKEIESIVRSKKKIIQVIYNELEEGIELFGRPRQCKVIKRSQIKRHVGHFRFVVTNGYVKKMSLSGKQVGFLEQDDNIVAYYPDVADTDIIYVVDKYGRLYPLKVENVIPCDQSSKGVDITTITKMRGKDVVGALRVSEERRTQYASLPEKENSTEVVVMYTKSGIIKASPFSQYTNVRSNEIQGLLLNDDDEVTLVYAVDTLDPDSDRLIYTRYGNGVVVDMTTVKVTDRLTKGASHLKFKDGDYVEGVVRSKGISEVCIVTNKGYGKIAELADIFIQKTRKSDMVSLTGLVEDDYVLKVIAVDEDFDLGKVVITTNSGKKLEVPFTDIPRTTRYSKGERLVKVRKTDPIARVKIVQ